MDMTLTPPRALGASLGARQAASSQLALEDFDALVVAHQRRIYRVLLGLVRDPDAADTLTQECFLRAYRNRAGFRGESSVPTWLIRIAVNLATDHARSRRVAFWRRLFARRSSEDPEAQTRTLADPVPSPERALAAREELAAVWAAAEELPTQQRAIFLLRFGEDLTLGEISRAMQLEIGTVKSHLSRALAAVRKRMKEPQCNEMHT